MTNPFKRLPYAIQLRGRLLAPRKRHVNGTSAASGQEDKKSTRLLSAPAYVRAFRNASI
jgi:hypothetical protein